MKLFLPNCLIGYILVVQHILIKMRVIKRPLATFIYYTLIFILYRQNSRLLKYGGDLPDVS